MSYRHKPHPCRTCGERRAANKGARCRECYAAARRAGGVRRADDDNVTDAELDALIESRRATMPEKETNHGDGERSATLGRVPVLSGKRWRGRGLMI